MASTSPYVRVGLRLLPQSNKILFSRLPVLDTRCAYISSKAMRGYDLAKDKAKPWPYREKGYNQLHSMYDGVLKRFNENTAFIVVEGPPATGKTRLAKKLAEEFEMVYFPMVTASAYYINDYGFDLRTLDNQLPEHIRSYSEADFFKNPKSTKATFFQYIMYRYKYEQYIDALAHLFNTGEGVVLDRCAFSDKIFVDAMHKCGYLSTEEKNYFDKLRNYSLKHLMRPHLVIYLDATVEQTLENIKNRGQGEEKALTPPFLEEINASYKQGYLKDIAEHAELVVYDMSQELDPEMVVEDIERIDFDHYDENDTKMSDWRLEKDRHFKEKRWLYTDRKDYLLGRFNNLLDDLQLDNLNISSQDDVLLRSQVYRDAPGNMYRTGFNPSQGDNVLFKTSCISFNKTLSYETPPFNQS